MSREIKFRGYDKIADCWCYGTGITKDADIKDRYWLIFDDASKTIIDDKTSIGQFTGLLDRNGVEIYEGDILSSENVKNATVEFKDGSWFAISNGFYIIPTYFWNTEIIGNIYQNPELLTN